jgi:segregation and condensation protein B
VTMRGPDGAKTARRKERTSPADGASARLYDRELEDLPAELRWREWMLRIEAVLFAAAEPVSREMLARVVGRDCSIDLLIEDLRAELSDRPYEVAPVAGGWQYRTRPRYAETIRASAAPTRAPTAALSKFEAMALTAIAYFQPITRGDLSKIFGKEVSRDTIAALRNADFLASGPRSPTPGAPYTYVTTKQFLTAFGMETLRDLPDIEALEDAGLLSRREMAAEPGSGLSDEDDPQED